VIYHVTARDLHGDIRFRIGYNAVISVIEFDNAIEIGSGVGAGAGEACDRVPLSSQSSMSSSSGVLGAPKCKDIFNTINGVRPSSQGDFDLVPLSSGLTVESQPDNHKIVVKFLGGSNKPYCRA